MAVAVGSGVFAFDSRTGAPDLTLESVVREPAAPLSLAAGILALAAGCGVQRADHYAPATHPRSSS